MEEQNQEAQKLQDQFVIEQLGIENVNLKIENSRLRFVLKQLTEEQQESQES